MARSSDSNFLVALFKDKTFQAREIRRVIGLAALYLVITTVMVGIFYHTLLGSLIEGASPLFFVSEDMKLFNESIPGMKSVLGKWIVAMLVINVIITAAISTYIIRKLGHPILAIKRALRQIGEGDLDVRLRASDDKEFGEISEALGTAMQTIHERIGQAQQEVGALKELQNSPAANAADIEEAVASCHEALSFFKPTDSSNGQRPSIN